MDEPESKTDESSFQKQVSKTNKDKISFYRSINFSRGNKEFQKINVKYLVNGWNW